MCVVPSSPFSQFVFLSSFFFSIVVQVKPSRGRIRIRAARSSTRYTRNCCWLQHILLELPLSMPTSWSSSWSDSFLMHPKFILSLPASSKRPLLFGRTNELFASSSDFGTVAVLDTDSCCARRFLLLFLFLPFSPRYQLRIVASFFVLLVTKKEK